MSVSKFPLFIGFKPLDREDCYSLDLDPGVKWEGFMIEWREYGVIVFVRPCKAQR